MTREEEIALLRRAGDLCAQDEDADVVKQGAVFTGASTAMWHYPLHEPDGLDTLLYIAEHVEDYIQSAKLLKAMTT